MKELLNAAGGHYGFGKQKRGKKDHYNLPVHINVHVKAYHMVLHFRISSALFPRLGFYVLHISPAPL